MLGFYTGLPYSRQVLIVYIFAIFMTVIDGTMVNVALPTLARQFGVEPADSEFIAVGYLLAVAAIIPAAGWLGDRFGTRKIFLFSLALFVITSLLCGIAQTLDQLILARVLQGAGGGLLAPIGSAIMFRAFPLNERATAATAVLSVAVVAPATGPVLGGVLVDQTSWRWIFLINLPIGIVAYALGHVTLRPDKQDQPGRFDGWGLVLSAGSITALLFALDQVPQRGWGSPLVYGLAVAGTIGIVLLVWVETHIEHPMLALRLFKDHLFSRINLTAALVYGCFFGFIFILPIYLQTLRGFSASTSGLVQAPQAVGIFIVSNTIGKAVYRMIGPRRILFVSCWLLGGFTAVFGLFDLDTSLLVVALFSLLRGLAAGFAFIAIQTAVYATTSVADTGRAASLFNTQRQISFATGVALGATVLSAYLPAAGPPAARLAAHQYAFFATALLAIPAALLALMIDDDAVAETRGLAPVTAH